MKRRKFVILVVLSAAVSAVAAAGGTLGWFQGGRADTAGNAAVPITATESDHDAGTVLAGDRVTHVFEFKNRTGDVLRVNSDADIQTGCGCTYLTLSSREVRPDETAQVSLSIDTSQMKGPFSYRSQVTWTGSGEIPQVFVVGVRGTVLPPLQCDPDLLSFDHSDVRKSGVTKEVVVTGNGSERLAGWAVTSDTGSFRVIRVEAAGERAARVTVGCEMPAGIETVAGSLKITAMRQPTHPSSDVAIPQLAINLPLRASCEIDFAIVPTILTLSADRTSGIAQGSLLLRGSLVALRHPAVKSVRCEGAKVEWVLSDPSISKTSVLRITLSGLVGARTPPVALILEVDGKGTVVVPVVLSPSDVR